MFLSYIVDETFPPSLLEANPAIPAPTKTPTVPTAPPMAAPTPGMGIAI